MKELTVIQLGRRDYEEMVAVQERLVEARLAGRSGDLLLLLEHPSTYTLGRRSEPSDLLHDHEWYRQRGVSVCETPRGGKVTFHGPGQLVAYPIVDLRGIGDQPAGADRVDVAGFVRHLEGAMAAYLDELGVAAGRIEGLTGLWVDDGRGTPWEFEGADAVSAAPGVARGSIRKIGAIGLKISRGISSHGLSLNVSCDLEPFAWINSCGIDSCRATSLAAETGTEAPAVDEVGERLAAHLAASLGREPVHGSAGSIGLARPDRADSVA